MMRKRDTDLELYGCLEMESAGLRRRVRGGRFDVKDISSLMWIAGRNTNE